MIVTDHFVYIHVSRTGGTFLNRLILSQFPGARMLQYHGHLENLPPVYAHLPVIGFVRNPWDWYVSMFNDYQRKPQFVFQALSNNGRLDFQNTVTRFLNLGDKSPESQELLRQLIELAPETLDPQQPRGNTLPGLEEKHFACYPTGVGYYSWLFELMFRSKHEQQIHHGLFENLREDTLRLFEETGVTITKHMMAYLKLEPRLNKSVRPVEYTGIYSPELRELLAKREQAIIERFGYEFG